MNLALITNNRDLALQAELLGIDRIIIDLEILGKQDRQTGKNLFLSDHTLSDIFKIKSVLRSIPVMVRVNPWHNGSPDEIQQVISEGADMIMLPYFTAPVQAEQFLACVNNRVKTSLLVETREAITTIDTLLCYPMDEIYIGLNDLAISMQRTKIFEVTYEGFFDQVCAKLKKSGIPFGWGGLARLSSTHLPIDPECILAQQIYHGATVAWLGRTFRDGLDNHFSEMEREIIQLRNAIDKWKKATLQDFIENRNKLMQQVNAWNKPVELNHSGKGIN